MARKKKVTVEGTAEIITPEVESVPEQLDIVEAAPAETIAEPVAEKVEEGVTEIATEPVTEDTPEPVAEPVEDPKPVKEEPKVKKTVKADKKHSLSVGTKELFAARIYPSSVAKKPIALAQGTIYIVDTEVHDGRIRVALNELLEKIGWADISEIER
jgi:hypothetical protein